MKKILFVAYGGGHINIIDLIAQKLLDEPHMEFTILALTTAYNKVADKYPEGIVKKVSDYMHIFDSELTSINTYGQELLAENYNGSSGISKEDTIIYLGCSMHDLVHKYGKEEAKKLYALKKRQAFLPIETMKKIIGYEKCDIVVSTTSPRFEQAGFIAGNQLGIATVEILDLFGDLHPLPEAMHIVCMNKDVEESLKKLGLTNRKYYHFGQPAIEESAKSILLINKDAVYKKMNIDDKKKTIVYASQVPILHNEDGTFHSILEYDLINKDVFDLLENLYNKYNINIIFRLHPNEDIKHYRTYFKKYRFIYYVNDDLNLHETIAIADLVLTPYSTVAIEALVANKFVFTFQMDFDACYPVSEMKKKPFIFSNGFRALEANIDYFFKNLQKIKKTEDFLPENSVENIIKLLKGL